MLELETDMHEFWFVQSESIPIKSLEHKNPTHPKFVVMTTHPSRVREGKDRGHHGENEDHKTRSLTFWVSSHPKITDMLQVGTRSEVYSSLRGRYAYAKWPLRTWTHFLWIVGMNSRLIIRSEKKQMANRVCFPLESSSLRTKKQTSLLDWRKTRGDL